MSPIPLMSRRASAKREYMIAIAIAGIVIAIVGGFLSRASRDREILRLMQERDAQIRQILATRPTATAPATTSQPADGGEAVREIREEYDRRIEARRPR